MIVKLIERQGSYDRPVTVNIEGPWTYDETSGVLNLANGVPIRLAEASREPFAAWIERQRPTDLTGSDPDLDEWLAYLEGGGEATRERWEAMKRENEEIGRQLRNIAPGDPRGESLLQRSLRLESELGY